MRFNPLWINTALKLRECRERGVKVSIPYGLTLLSNIALSLLWLLGVSIPYGLTLLSNSLIAVMYSNTVSIPYGLTLLSNYDMSLSQDQFVSIPYGLTLLSNGTDGQAFSPRFQSPMD